MTTNSKPLALAHSPLLIHNAPAEAAPALLAECWRQREELADMTRFRNMNNAELGRMTEKSNTQREQIQALRGALRWYVTGKGTPDFDGEIGRAALAALDAAGSP